MKRVAVLVGLAMLFAGCVSPDEAGTDAADAEPELTIDANRPTESFADLETVGTIVGPDLDATTAAAPELIEGEWWRIRFQDFLDQGTVDVIRVVADVNEDGYVFGMPHSGWLKEAISFHSPAFGDVNFDLSYNTHNLLFQPVKFPLTVGETWETVFATSHFIATVESADETTAEIVFRAPEADPEPTDPVLAAIGLAGPGAEIRLIYDAQQHEIVRMDSAIGFWEVVEHGYDFEGWVTVPRGEHTAIDYGTFGPASDSHTPTERTVDVEGGFNRMTMMMLVGTINDAPGYFKAREVSPTGEEFVTELQGAGFVIKFYEARDPDGAWITEDIVGGTGFTYHMGIAYHQYDIKLPGGALRSDHSHEVIR